MRTPAAELRRGGEQMFEQACRANLEGIISKRVDGPYRPGRGRDWVKVKCVREQEFVIAGFTEPAGSRAGLGALLGGDERTDEDDPLTLLA